MLGNAESFDLGHFGTLPAHIIFTATPSIGLNGYKRVYVDWDRLNKQLCISPIKRNCKAQNQAPSGFCWGIQQDVLVLLRLEKQTNYGVSLGIPRFPPSQLIKPIVNHNRTQRSECTLLVQRPLPTERRPTYTNWAQIHTKDRHKRSGSNQRLLTNLHS